MQNINAVSFTANANEWLTNSRHPRILHIFDQVCNLINEYKDVLSIVTPQIGDGPFNLVVESEVSFSEAINLQSPISNSPHHLTVGSINIHTTGAELWNPYPDWEMLHTKRDEITKIVLAIYQKCGLDTGCAKNTQPYSTTTFNPNLLITNSQFSNSLVLSLATANLPSSISAAQKLAGLGIGLTPSGDDFIMGALYAAWIIHPLEIANVLAEEIAEAAAPLTTSLSSAWLRSAGKGEVGILWHDLFNALMASENIQLPIVNLLAVGETSGADALAGFFGVMSAFKDIIEECPS